MNIFFDNKHAVVFGNMIQNVMPLADENPLEAKAFDQTSMAEVLDGLFGRDLGFSPIELAPGAVSYTHLTLPTKA